MSNPGNYSVVVGGPPYDVFLGACFGFCYASALVPCVKMLEVYKCTSHPDKPTVWILIRGLLTVMGLACLYGWYAIYFRRIYANGLPAARVLLDWISLGLFAVGANWWNNRRNDEELYYWVQAAAILAFGATCVFALARDTLHGDSLKPLIRSIFWCGVLIGSFVFSLILFPVSKRIKIDGPQKARRRACWALGLFVVVSGVSSYLFHLLMNETAPDYIETFSLGEKIVSVIGALGAYGLVGLTAVGLSEQPTDGERLIAAITTYLPMVVLILVTVFSQRELF